MKPRRFMHIDLETRDRNDRPGICICLLPSQYAAAKREGMIETDAEGEFIRFLGDGRVRVVRQSLTVGPRS